MPCRFGIASLSLGRASAHKLPEKLRQAHVYGIEGVEIFYEDLEYHARDLSASEPDRSPSPDALLRAAVDVRNLCEQYSLAIIVLQPFSGYEGLLDREAHAHMLDKLRLWFRIAHVLRTDVIQIPSSFLSAAETSDDMDLIVSDMVEVAEMGAREEPPITFAYEALCFGTHVNRWEQAYEVVRRVNRPNFQTCLDTYNICGRAYADPAAKGGLAPDAAAEMQRSMQRMLDTVDVKKINFLQVVDAEWLDAPLVKGHELYDPEQTPRMSWSRSCRLFYGERDRGAFLPVTQVCKTVLEGLGFDGWVSFELFNKSLSEPRAEVPEEHARRAAVAWKKMKEDINF